MGVFRLNRETTKARTVYLSNLVEKTNDGCRTVSHNQAMYSGPALNQKLSTALMHLRFDDKLLCFDLEKAFNMISLKECDQNKLLFFWYKNVRKGDFSIVAYRCKRVNFGLRCSPALLTLGLYKMLILDAESDSENLKNLKKQIYSLFYVDNGGFTFKNSDQLKWAYEKLDSVFSPYKFKIQQVVTNDLSLQDTVDQNLTEKTSSTVKLLGMQWNRINDKLFANKLCLNINAQTKREIIASIASQFDLFNIYGPLLNRSRIFLHELQCIKGLSWDEKLNSSQLREWTNIVKEANATPEIEIKRSMGSREDKYRLVAFTDSSGLIYGAVVYLQNLKTMEFHFLTSKSRIVNKQLKNKSIPQLELQGVAFGTELLVELHDELAGPDCMLPIKLEQSLLFSDSLVVLNWLNSHSHKLDKMQKLSVFAQNRLDTISRLCEKHSITYSFITGINNPADPVTRPISYKRLLKTAFLSGPSLMIDREDDSSLTDLITVTIPEPTTMTENITTNINSLTVQVDQNDKLTHFVDINKYSSLSSYLNINEKVLRFLNGFKKRLKKKNSVKYKNLEIKSEAEIKKEALKYMIRVEQQTHFADVTNYFKNVKVPSKNIPNLVTQLNLYPDNDGILRVNNKGRGDINKFNDRFPILLPKTSPLTTLIIRDTHEDLEHIGCYTLLAELRKQYYIPHYFSAVKTVLKACVICKRNNNRTIKLNQSPYREMRLAPDEKPFSNCYLDYTGSYDVRKEDGSVTKYYLLILSCMWSRAIEIKICTDASTDEFLRAFQLHVFSWGLPTHCISDLGSNLASSSKIIKNYLNDADTQNYFAANDIKSLEYDHTPKGNSSLAGLVESSVKGVKRLITGAIGHNILTVKDFEFLIAQTVHLVNRRPVAFKEGLRDKISDEVPEPITPERLLRGYDLVSINVVPNLHIEDSNDITWEDKDNVKKIKTNFDKLNKVRKKLVELYHSEFLATLITQAVDRKDRYKPVKHQGLNIGDIVLIKDSFTKPSNYPMARVLEVYKNDLNEVTHCVVLKGSTKEKSKRHVNCLIKLLEVKTENESDTNKISNNLNAKSKDDESNKKLNIADSIVKTKKSASKTCENVRLPRKAAEKCKKRLAALNDADLI